MAKMKIDLPDELIEKISRLGSRTDAVMESVLKAGGEVLLNQVRGNLRSVIGANLKAPARSTGKLYSSLGLSPVKIDNAGNSNVKVGFTEDRTPSNAMLANIKERGKKGQRAKPFMKPAIRATKGQVLEAMKRKFEDEIR